MRSQPAGYGYFSLDNKVLFSQNNTASIEVILGICRLIWTFISLLMMLLPVPASAAPTSALINGVMQKNAVKPGTVEQSEIDPAALIEEIKTKLAATNEKLAVVPSNTVNGLADVNDTTKRRLLLRQLVYLYQGQLDRLTNLQEVQKSRIELERNAADWLGFTEQTAHPFLRADELQESVQILAGRLDELKSWMTVLYQMGEFAVNAVKASTVKLRQMDEAVERAKNSPEQQASLSLERDLLGLQNQIDMARAVAFQIEKQMNQEAFLKNRAKLQLDRKQLSVASDHVEMTQRDIEQIHKNLEKESRQIIAEINQTVSALEAIHRKNPVPGITSETETPQSEGLGQIEQIRQLQLDNNDIKLQMLNRILSYLEMQRDIWDLRWAYAKVADREKVNEAYAQISDYQKFLQLVYEYINLQRQRTMTLVTNQVIKNIGQPVDGPNTLNKTPGKPDFDQVVSYSRLLGSVVSTQNLLERFKQELDRKFLAKSLPDYLDEALLASRDFLSQVWKFEIFAAQDTILVDGQQISSKRSISVDKVVMALAILTLGYWLAVRLSRVFEDLAVTRFGMEVSTARIARRWILFLEVMILLLASMSVAMIPLTIFAFMGGAVAIGAGFGMQNLLKNLISGLMLLMERPFRPGDMVEVGGIRGRVIDIGVRSSHILDANGIETLIPNSTFIEQNVTNWTLSSQSVRIVVNIGIAYGSPVKEVTGLLIDVAARHGLVLDDPAPQVLFEDFGSDALIFGLYVWVELKREVSWKEIASDLRFMINKTLSEHGIEIAFPQRDIHIDSSRPLEVRVLADAPEAGS